MIDTFYIFVDNYSVVTLMLYNFYNNFNRHSEQRQEHFYEQTKKGFCDF